MNIQMRPYSGTADLIAMVDLVRRFPTHNIHRIDLPYRFSSWGLDAPKNIGLWFTADGQLAAWAILQTPFWTFDYAYHPDIPGLHPQLLAWIDERAHQTLATPAGHPIWFINVLQNETARMQELEAHGFASQENVGEDSWSKVWLHCSAAKTALQPATLPNGFTIRPLAGLDEVPAYVELHQTVFESRNMTVEWRTRTLQQPDYLPDLDLVAVAPDGRLVAFCIGWLDRRSDPLSGQIEPLGVHSDFRGMGLGQALLTETLQRLIQHGAQQLYVETDAGRNPALNLYQSVGFQLEQKILVYRKDYLPDQE